MATFQDLPLELIIEMVKFFTTRRPTGELDSRNDLCTLRVVSTLFNDLVTPVLFEVLCLNFDNAKLNVLRSNHERRATGILRYRDILTALATGSASVIRQHTKRVELYLRKLYWVDENRLGVVETRKAIEEHLFSAISSLKNLQTVDWHCHFEYEPEQVTRDIILALSTIPSFESFNKLQFLSEPPASFSLKPLSNMRFFDMSFDVLPSKNIISETALLLSRSPNISGFSFRGGEPFQANLDDFFENNKLDQPLRLKTLELSSVLVTPETIRANLSHFKELEFLGITNNLDDSPANFGAICAILEQNNIFLKGILTDTTDLTSVFNYLSSYSGVETICIMLPSIPSDAQKLVDRLYEQVLPRHQETLKYAQVAEIVKCQRLQTVIIHWGYTLKTIEENDISIPNKWVEAAMQLPKLQQLRIIGSYAGCASANRITNVWGSTRIERALRQAVSQAKKMRGLTFRFNE